MTAYLSHCTCFDREAQEVAALVDQGVDQWTASREVYAPDVLTLRTSRRGIKAWARAEVRRMTADWWAA